MQEVRALFTKSGSAKYISHLDLTRIMSRSFRRAGIPIWYTEGFNPHPFFTFALPLSLGSNSTYETMDFKITEDMPFEEILSRINPCLPEGITVTEVFKPVMKHTLISWAKYKIEARSDVVSADDLFEALQKFIGRPEIIVAKKTKSKAIKEFDIKATIKEINLLKDGEKIIIEIITPAGCTDNVNPSLLTASFETEFENFKPEFEITRTAVYSSDMQNFR